MKNYKNYFYVVKQKQCLRWPVKLILMIAVFFILALIYPSLFVQAGLFLEMSNGTDVRSDVIVVEGGHTLSCMKVQEAERLLNLGFGSRILFILHFCEPDYSPFALGDYEARVRAGVDSLGIPSQDFDIIEVAISPPYTLTEARAVTEYLRSFQVNSILLVADGFHMRRTFYVYRKLLSSIDVTVHPKHVQGSFDARNWWLYPNGVRFVLGEYLKLSYYWVHGYL